MNRAERRANKLPPRPQIMNEQMQAQVRAAMGDGPQILDREQSMFIIASLAANLQRQLNQNAKMPLVQCTTDKRATGVSIHLNLVEPTGENDAVVI